MISRNYQSPPSTARRGVCIFFVSRNPRALFPVRDDFIRSAWVQRARTERAQEYEELYPYTSPAFCYASRASAAAAALRVPGAKASASTGTQRPTNKPNGLPAQEMAAGRHVSSKKTSPCASHMGVGSSPRNVAEFRRAFRRLEPEKMFRAPRTEGEPIWAYWGAGSNGGSQSQPPLPPGRRASTTEGFILVPAKELAEVRILEGALRHERTVLNAHCLLAMNEGEVRRFCTKCWMLSWEWEDLAVS